MNPGCCPKRSLLRNTHGDVSILPSPFLGGVVRDGVLLPVTLGGEAVWGNTLANQLSHDALGPIPGKAKIWLSSSYIVGIAGDRHSDTGTTRQKRCNVIELPCDSGRSVAILYRTPADQN